MTNLTYPQRQDHERYGHCAEWRDESEMCSQCGAGGRFQVLGPGGRHLGYVTADSRASAARHAMTYPWKDGPAIRITRA